MWITTRGRSRQWMRRTCCGPHHGGIEMGQWIIKHGNILDEPADVLVCSGNVFLNLSGGVGGALMLRYGEQRELHGILRQRGVKFVPRGTVVEVGACGTPYRAVLHAVAVDGFYESSASVVEGLLQQCLRRAAELGARRVAVAALATGYGRLSIEDFGRAARSVMGEKLESVMEVVACVSREEVAEQLRATIRACGESLPHR